MIAYGLIYGHDGGEIVPETFCMYDLRGFKPEHFEHFMKVGEPGLINFDREVEGNDREDVLSRKALDEILEEFGGEIITLPRVRSA